MLDIPRLTVYLTVMAITPGPNNVMVTASAARFGYRATLPHILGIAAGALAQTLLVFFGVWALIERLPGVHVALAWTGAGYLAYLAWKLVRAGPLAAGAAARPLTWIAAAAFQLINPKAWTMAFTTAVMFLPHGAPSLETTALVGLILVIVILPAVSAWALFGTVLSRTLRRASYHLAFNVTIAALLLLTAAAGLRS